MSVSDPLVGRMLGDYRVIDLLGRGGMARVYRGYDPKLERYAAIKVIDAHLLSSQENEEEYRARFRREARAIARLRHSNIVGIYQYGEVDALYYMAMVFIEGRDLGHILKEHAARGTKISLSQVLRIVRDMGAALDYAHAGGVIHRDVKPSNVMVSPDGQSVLTDFGLALSVPEGSIGNTFGSAHYIAPEQAVSSAQAVPQSDIYSLAVVIYQMLTGKVPFDDPSAMSVALKHIGDPPPPIRRFAPELPAEVEQVIFRALEKNPNNRYENGEMLFFALEHALAPVLEGSAPISRLRPPITDSHPSIGRRLSTDEFERVGEPYGTTNATNPAPNPRNIKATWSEKLPIEASIAATQAQRTDAQKRSRLPMFIAALLVFALVAVGIFALATNNPSVMSPSATPQASFSFVIGDTTETEPPLVVAQATVSPSAMPTRNTSTSLPTRTRILPTQTPANIINDGELIATAEATIEAVPEATAEATVDVESAPIILLYDAQRLVFYNRSAQTVDVTNLRFVRMNQLGREIAFDTSSWGDTTTIPLSQMPPGTCFQVWLISMNAQATPDYCETRLGWVAVGTTRQFWISSEHDRTFEVRRGSQVIAICPTNGEECALEF